MLSAPPSPADKKQPWQTGSIWAMVILVGMTYVTIFVENAARSEPRITSLSQLVWLVLVGVAFAALSLYDDQWVNPNQPIFIIIGYYAAMFALFIGIGYFSHAQGQWWLAGLLIVGMGAKLSLRWTVGVSVAVMATIIGIYYGLYRDYSILYQVPLFITPAIFFVALFTRVADRERTMREGMEALAAELRLANQRLAEYAAQVEEMAIVQERNRMAREIHDSLGHYLTVVNVQIGAARAIMDKNPEKAQDALFKAQKLTQEGLTEVRHSVSALRETAEEAPLPDQLARLAAESEAAGLPTHVTVYGEPRPLANKLIRTLYRAAQEALTNSRKHAQATQAEVALDYTQPHSIALQVQDDGRGSAVPTGGYGLLGLRERVALLGGHVEITTAAGQGFTIHIILDEATNAL